VNNEIRKRRRRSSGLRTKGELKQSPWRIAQSPYQPFEIVSRDQIESIHQASLRVLREQGMEILHGPAREVLAAHGATVQGEQVCLEPEMVESPVTLFTWRVGARLNRRICPPSPAISTCTEPISH